MNALATFQKCMNDCLDGLRGNICTPYLDILVYSKTVDEHVRDVRKILRRLHEYVIELEPSKFKFFQRQVIYLGRVVSGDSHSLDPADMAALNNLAKQILELLQTIHPGFLTRS